jgi:metal-dependent amidase/aminoacylase/carboxypeptidase family protein
VEILDLIENRMAKIVQMTAQAYDCEVHFDFVREYPPTVNSEAEVVFAAEVMRDIVGTDNVNAKIEPTMGAEDFAFMLLEKPGCYAFLGNGEGGHRDMGHGVGPCMLHNPSYDFNDELLTIGSSYFVKLVAKYLEA